MKINLNSDIGEGNRNDALIMPYLTACNIACGGHFGNEKTITQTIQLAQKHKVKIGAHPSYPDFENFGRLSLKISDGDLSQSLTIQLSQFENIVDKQNTNLHHIKAHGALYNDIAKDKQKAELYLKVLAKYRENCILFVPPNSIILDLSKQHGFKVCVEAFADRTYNDDLSLVNRKLPNAIIHQPEKALQQVLSIIENEEVTSITGKKIAIKANTFCVHGDTVNAIEIIQHIYAHFSTKTHN